jgi:hypothetical protein
MAALSIDDTLRQRPAVHMLCSGVFIQEHVWVTEDLVVVPLKALGFNAQAAYLAHYTTSVAGVPVDEGGLESLRQQGKDSLPVAVFCRLCAVDASPEELERLAATDLDTARQIIGWSSSNEVTPFGMLTLTSSQGYFRVLPPRENQRLRLGFGNTGVAFHTQIASLFQTALRDERFAFALSLHHDALRETNQLFRAARFFNCLECLAAKLKAEAGGSRKAVKMLLGFQDGATIEVAIAGQRYRYDPIEIAGRIRDKLWHGVPFKAEDLIVETRSVFRLIQDHPETLADNLQVHSELELARWVNGVSKGLRE